MKKIKAFIPYFLSIISILGGAYYLYVQVDAFDPSSVSKEMVSSWDEHMKPVRDALPSTVFEIGYLEASDIPTADVVYDDAEFFMTQYALAPVALKKGFHTSWIVGNFGPGYSLRDVQPWLEGALLKYDIQDLGFGIYLIHDISE